LWGSKSSRSWEWTKTSLRCLDPCGRRGRQPRCWGVEVRAAALGQRDM
jgi:hypothetical protein